MKKILFVFIITWAVTAQAFNLWDWISSINALNTPNFDEIKDTNQRKIAFFGYLLPMVEEENRKIKLVRSLVKNNQFNDSQIKKLAKKYRVKNISKKALLNAIDTIPTSLALAQAAIESNWGRSRFSKRWHNYFGIWCFSPGCGIVPENRNKNAKYEVKNFSSTNKSIEYYLLNINRNYAYELLRKIRAYKRKHNLKLTGTSLAEGLDKYSNIGYEYIELVQSIIRQNNLTRFD
ncbi:hypothetical protein [uncultured Gammaproteobacteria bacterium]|nr:hypothetical protein [uncultured Gammaproteobacteria bacterium]SMN14660.1 BAX protein [uncultured Candidatus Thioglobus sp.]